MSSTDMTVSSHIYSYDFSSALTQAYGGGAGYKQIFPGGPGIGVYGMVTGDIDQDGAVFISDRAIWITNSGSAGSYKPADLDFDGSVYVTDRAKWIINSGSNNPIEKSALLLNLQPVLKAKYSSQVPENK